MEQDWRYENAKHLQGVHFTYATYVQPSREWDHDHCVGCWQEFAEKGEAPDVLWAGFVTDSEDWICPTCFADIGPTLGWSAEDQPDDQG